IERETIAAITVEEETDEVNEAPLIAPRQVAELEASANIGRRPTSGVRTWKRAARSPLVLAALILVVSVLTIASAWTIRRIQRSRTAANRFRQIKLLRLTNGGGVGAAAISPDGKFFVFAHAEKGKQSLRLGQTSGEPPIDLRPSADIFYRGVEFAP